MSHGYLFWSEKIPMRKPDADLRSKVAAVPCPFHERPARDAGRSPFEVARAPTVIGVVLGSVVIAGVAAL
jgi:hypothetical protein